MALNLFDRNQYTQTPGQFAQSPDSNQPLPEEPAPLLDDDEYRERTGPRWTLIAGLLVGALVVALAVVFGGRWLYNQLSDNEPANIGQQTASDKQPAAPQSGSQPTAPQPTPQPAPTPAPAQPPSTTPSTPAPSQPLPDSGPGAVVALFVGSSLLAAGLHYIIRLRRQAGA